MASGSSNPNLNIYFLREFFFMPYKLSKYLDMINNLSIYFLPQKPKSHRNTVVVSFFIAKYAFR